MTMFPNSVSWTRDQLQRETTNSAFTLPWMERLSLECENLNNEHHALLQVLNGLLMAIGSREPTRIAMACTVLSVEAQSHFTSEEEQMREAGYPDLESHVARHKELHRALALLRYSASSGTGFVSTTAPLSSLERWFVPHLTFDDKLVADFLAARAVLSRIGIEMHGMVGGLERVGAEGDDPNVGVAKRPVRLDDFGNAALHDGAGLVPDAAPSP